VPSCSTRAQRNNLPPCTREELFRSACWGEWLQGHLPRAISIPLLDLAANTHFTMRGARDPAAGSGGSGSFPTLKPVVAPAIRSLIYCREGFRATTAASLLLRQSVGTIGILVDGVQGWSRLGLALQTPDN